MKKPKNEAETKLLELAGEWNRDARARREKLRNKPKPAPSTEKPPAPSTEKPTDRRDIGDGSLFLRPPSKNWFIGYYRADGKRVKESTGTPDEKKANRILQDRLGERARGEVVETAKVKISKLYEDWLQWVTVNQNERGSRSVEELGWRWKHLSPVFGHLKASALSTPSLVAYQGMRQRAGAQNSTINRELATLRKLLYYGVETHRIKALPCTFSKLKENPARQDFIELAEFKRLADGATGWMRTFLELAFSYGWRKSEILSLRIQQGNFSTRTIRLNPGTTKNGEGREVAMTAKGRGTAPRGGKGPGEK
jgi:Phage integrase family